MCTVHVLKCPHCLSCEPIRQVCELTLPHGICQRNQTNLVTTHRLDNGCNNCRERPGSYCSGGYVVEMPSLPRRWSRKYGHD
ncbi:hypothetical protein CABS01_16421 [Colletotrichum abscissum]|uniref:uncharacterized protein n=1 Tax=Colletotrichum abscissum TaxID=1671311 RepID=UPI0027D73313|nr:uncharacterized protein CABS01_16421 [Colletotrichum abscissum]KAK1471268.1 hypothetical protein CABS01_16421 [Colletotrichum abscissum]